MGRAHHLIAIATALCLSGSIRAADAPAKTAAAEKPAVAPATPKRPVNLAPQVAELQKEWQANQKDPKASKLRAKPDYFKEHPNPEVTPEAIIKALEGGVAGGPGAEAYVKWQLLSGIPGKFPDDLVRRALAVYHRAPELESHPGFNRRELKRAIMGKKTRDAAEIQKELSEVVSEVKDRNDVILDYRNELYAKLPGRLEVYQAGLEDAADRAGRGLNATSIFDNVSAGLRGWAIGDAKPGQVNGMIAAIRRLREMITREDARPYAKIGDDKGMAKWDVAGYAIDPKKIDELIQFLENNAAGAAGGGLKFKDPKDK